MRTMSSREGDDKGPRVEMPKMSAEQCESVESETMVEERPETKEAYKRFPNDVNPRTGEIGGPRGPEPTRYGDWERKGRAIDF